MRTPRLPLLAVLVTLASASFGATACSSSGDGAVAQSSSQALAALDPTEVVGTIAYGQTVGPIAYSETPLFRALSFQGSAGDAISVTVACQSMAMAWLLGSDFSTLASNYAARTNDPATFSFTLPATGTYYIAFREANLENVGFTVSLALASPACTAGQTCTPANSCHTGTTVCAAGVSSCQDTGSSVTDGTACGSSSEVCSGGACGASTFTVAGPSMGVMYVDDDLVVAVNGNQVYSDLGHGAANRNPIPLTTSPGDIVTMSFFDTFGGSRGHSDIWLSGPGVAAQKIESGFSGSGSSYPAQTSQPFDILVFTVPAAAQTPTLGCLPNVPLETSIWPKVANLVIQTATTQAYDVTWTVNSHAYTYTPDCNGWVTDTFIAPDGSWANVGWNTITHAMQTSATPGHDYSNTIATSAASYAVQTLFPAGDMGLLTIH